MMIDAAARETEMYQFLEGEVKRIPGWLEDYAAIRTMELLDWQNLMGIRGPLLEIGVFAGRHFSVMLRAAAPQGDWTYGIDTFQWVPEDQVRANLAPIGGRFDLIKGMSTEFTAPELLARFVEKPRFISIDGSHDCDDVFWDFTLSEQILSSTGMISADDFLNPLTLGVNEAINRFFSTPRNLAPFAYTSNKLFLCRPAMADRYKEILEKMVIADQRQPQSAAFRERATHGRHHVEQQMWGRRVLIPC
jgi:hypothetical protein